MNEPAFPRTLVFSARGYLGKHFLEFYRSFHPSAIGTHHQTNTQGLMIIDFLDPQVEEILQQDGSYKYALIAGAYSRPAICEQFPEKSRRCNVEGTLQIAKACIERDITPIIFSSDYVFDGKEGDYTESSSTSPVNEYGRQKALLEEKVLEKYPDKALLIRLGKVTGNQKGDCAMLDEMAAALIHDRKIKAAVDQIFCPILVQDVVYAISELQKKNLRGLFNLCGQEKWSRYDLALEVCRCLGKNPELIEKINLAELNDPFSRPGNTAMQTKKLHLHLSSAFSSIKVCCQQIAREYLNEDKSRHFTYASTTA